ncbi:MAG TPA: AbrB/MazE/SpoVT family DNA-binding domain-containing protein [Candidatus Limnocylindria bacterium]|nr:AbrB/MazE/SpoVT family DNA-binding domain-containing protein [Candidatus Limnocylindria bacterium]
MYRARVTSKGQVTIPSAVRDQLGLRTGDELLFEPKTLRFSAAPRPKLSELYGILAPTGPLPPFDRDTERAQAAAAAGRYDAEKTAKIVKRRRQ